MNVKVILSVQNGALLGFSLELLYIFKLILENGHFYDIEACLTEIQ